MLNPFIGLLSTLIQLYLFCVIAWAILSTLISFRIINGHQPLASKIMFALDRLVQPALNPIRRVLPDLGGIDLSPIVLILLLGFLQQLVLGMGNMYMTWLAVIGLIRTVITLYAWCVAVYAVLGLLINLGMVNPYQALVSVVMNALRRLCGPPVMRIRRLIPPAGRFDFAPWILLFVLIAINMLLIYA